MDKDSYPSPVAGIIKAPSSKSYAQRAIVAALLCEGETTLLNMELCSDTSAALEAAKALGALVIQDDHFTYRITGGIRNGELHPRSRELFVEESGLSARMFAPVAAMSPEQVIITGSGTMLERPLGGISTPLRQLGATVTTQEDYLPVTVSGPLSGGEAEVDGSISSQFVTGLLMVLPVASSGTTLHVREPVSTPYIDMTIALLENFGVQVACDCDYTEFYIEGKQHFRPTVYNIEGDWSGASCLLVAGAIAGEITVTGLNPVSAQADVAIIEALSRAGAEITTTPQTVTVVKKELNAFSFDATNCPDLFPALVALAVNCNGTSQIKGLSRLRAKESDRAEALVAEYRALGIDIVADTESDFMRVQGGVIEGGIAESHSDHRMAMSLAVAGLRSLKGITVKGAESVVKSYPDFWDDLQSIRRDE